MPILGPVFKRVAISRFSRTLGTLASNGVPILQALTIVRQTVGNVIISEIIATVHERVKEGDPIARALRIPLVSGNGGGNGRCGRTDRSIAGNAT